MSDDVDVKDSAETGEIEVNSTDELILKILPGAVKDFEAVEAGALVSDFRIAVRVVNRVKAETNKYLDVKAVEVAIGKLSDDQRVRCGLVPRKADQEESVPIFEPVFDAPPPKSAPKRVRSKKPKKESKKVQTVNVEETTAEIESLNESQPSSEESCGSYVTNADSPLDQTQEAPLIVRTRPKLSAPTRLDLKDRKNHTDAEWFALAADKVPTAERYIPNIARVAGVSMGEFFEFLQRKENKKFAETHGIIRANLDPKRR